MDSCALGGLDLPAFATQKGTPFSIHDGPALTTRLQELRTALEGNLSLCGAVRSYPNPHLLRWMLPHLDGCIVRSGVELRLAVSVGYHPQRMDFIGPGKRDGELELAIGSGLASISLESEGELERIDHVGHRLGRKAPVMVRLQLPRSTMDEESQPDCFGFDQGEALTLITTLAGKTGCRYAGLFFGLDAAILQGDGLQDSLRRALATTSDLARSLGQWPRRLLLAAHDLSATRSNSGEALDLSAIYREISSLWLAFKSEHNPPTIDLVLEMGPSSGSRTTLHVTRVVAIKQTRYQEIGCILDGHVPASIPPGGAINLSRPDEKELLPLHLTGLCSASSDGPTRTMLPLPQVGDCIGIFQDGAYTGQTTALFSHPTHAEYLVDGPDHVKTVRHVVDPSRLGVPP
ncbi:MAG: hypothetical protein HQL64_11845 [Magnetococcales bacterium]|nr:hypothetical protein [Magnetococcales bacterium]